MSGPMDVVGTPAPGRGGAPRPRPIRRRAGAVLAGALALATGLGGCAHLSGKPTTAKAKVRHVHLRPMIVRAGGKPEMALVGMNAEELFQVGVAAYAAGNYEKAARAFTRILGDFPESDRGPEARYDAGLAWERMGEYLRALDAYRPLLDAATGKLWRDSAFRVAECLYHLEDYGHAAALLTRIADGAKDAPEIYVRAQVQKGICLLHGDRDDAAETALRRAVGRYLIEKDQHDTAIDPYYAAQGQFYLGELYRLRFEHAAFDPGTEGLDALKADLEHKAELLLSAQGHYLRTIRMGEAHWAAAAGYRVGRLYEILYDQLSAARPPASLTDPAERLAYRKLLHDRIQVLLKKAMSAYERTRATVERVGVDDAWKSRVEASFDRVKQLLLRQAASADEATAASGGASAAGAAPGSASPGAPAPPWAPAPAPPPRDPGPPAAPAPAPAG